ncbi:hypothetical protein BDV25DRAFT_168409 [Aspergillus avenaceus]|uniref:Pentatricopeptide repeat-containing protein-mitochondrial domain-containing protein n=1 Tax=Aspergillus avenaceus TaxID=36643 RepID=A0A5N6TQ66_ASPAV|nr:hypothetical protein BDV25DRAFT_168409 [Aspergillus avenaceus]
MPRQALMLDGLWYCLCPSFSLNSLRQSAFPHITPKRAPKPGQYPAFSARTQYSSRRCLSSNSPVAVDGHGAPLDTKSRRLSHSESSKHTSQLDDNQIPRNYASTEQGHERPPGAPKSLEDRSTSELEHKLGQVTLTDAPRIRSASQILRILIQDRHVRPEVRHYRALILANSDAERGSPEVVKELLAEMEANGLTLDSGTLHTALQVLAVHPDYLMRQDILRTLRDRWLPLSPDGWHYVVAGLVREHQFELALDHVAHMERKAIPIENWLHSMLVYYLCEFQEFDEVIRLMQSRVSQGYDMTPDLWLYVLDVASAATHLEATRFVWQQMVELRYLYPAYEICSNVLTVASRTGDTDLAASVARFLGDSDVPLGMKDYEKIAESHATSGDLNSGFEVLCEMHKAGIELKRSSTAAILTYMIQSRVNPRDAWSMLKQLKASGYEVPLRCALAVIELCEHEALNDPFIVDEGIALYKELYALCVEKANVLVYNSLIGMCRRAKNTDAAMFAVKELATLSVVPNATTFEHLVIMCLEASNFESAFMYHQDLLARELYFCEEVRAEIRRLCIGSNDQYADQLRHHPQIQAEGGPRKVVNTTESVESVLDKPSDLQGPTFGSWRLQTREERRAQVKEKRKQKRRRMAIAKNKGTEGWQDYEPGELIPSDEVRTKLDSPSS